MTRAAETAPLNTDRARLARYFQEAARLRLCLAYNLEDFRFARAGGRIVYLFDANIIRFFMDPEPEADRVVAFKSRDVDYASATALVTAEFLFSRELAGQKSSPAFVAPAHGDEIAEMIDKFLERAPVSDSESAVLEENRGSIEALLDQLLGEVDRGSTKVHQEAAEKLRKIVPQLADLLLDKWVPVDQLSRLYDQDLVRPLALNPAATADILWPEQSKVAEWTALIRKERRVGAGGGSSKRNARDAEALLQVMMLDEAAATSDGPEPVKFVLVTADTALLSAYAKWYWNQGIDGAEESTRRRFVLRDPLQYVPIINTFEMPNGVNDNVLSNLAVDALDSLFSNLRAVENSFPQKLAYYRILAQDESRDELLEAVFGVNPLLFSQEEEKSFVELRESWHRSFRTGVLLNVNLMQRRLRRQFSRLLVSMRVEHPLRKTIEEDQRRNLLRIQEAHAVFSTKMNVSDLIAESREGVHTIIPRERIPFLLRSHRLSLPAEVERLLKEEATAAEAEQLSRDCLAALEKEGNERALMMAAAIAYRCGHWSAARIYARRAMALGPDPATRTELEYVLASSVRHGLGALTERSPGNADLAEAEQALEHSVRWGEEQKDDFACARAMVERVALLVTVQRRAAVLGEDALEMSSGPELVAQAAKMEALLAKLEAQLYESEADKILVLTLRSHARAISFSALVGGRILAPAGGDNSVLDEGLRQLETELGLDDIDALVASPVVEAYRLAWQTYRRAGPARIAFQRLKDLAETVGDDPWLSELDHAEILRLSQALEAVSATAEPALLVAMS